VSAIGTATAVGFRPGPVQRGRTAARRDPVGAVALAVLVIIALTSIFAPVVAPYDPNKPGAEITAPPSLQHLAGTDQFGRDVLSRVIYGGRDSLAIGLGAAALGGIGSVVLALFFAYAGGWPDYLFQRLVDTVLALPFLVVIIVLVGTLGPSIGSIVLVLGLRLAITSSRVIRSAVLITRSQDYVMSAVVAGAGPVRIAIHHILPNILPLAIVSTSLQIGFLVLAEAALSFLGLGLPPPTATWGGMIGVDGRSYLTLAPWMLLAPATVLSLVVLSANMFGDSVRDILDPRIRSS
jgi:peptide/nickel transport system permease protein